MLASKQNETKNRSISLVTPKPTPIGDRKIANYKKVIKLLDILISLLVMAGCLLSQIENEMYHFENIYDRSEVVRLIAQSKMSVNINLSNFNISYLNDDSLREKYNLSKFTDNSGNKNYESLPIPLTIPHLCQHLREAILILSILSIPLVFIGRYLEYVREYHYIRRFHSK
jgi:hypothetical protein